jgi:energy-coupling factor transporter ATP-binding protein EcfA2
MLPVLLEDISKKWAACQSVVERERLWRHLMRPDGQWLSACKEAAQPSYDSTTALQMLADTQPDSLLAFNRVSLANAAEPGPDTILKIALGLQETGLSETTIKNLADSTGIPTGFASDIALHLTSSRPRPGRQDIKITCLLIDPDDNSVSVSLKLELVTNGSGAIYPVPELALCRDQAFMAQETLALAAISSLPADCDIRWSVTRLDGEEIASLSGPSMGAAFALGIKALVEPRNIVFDLDLESVAVCAAITSTGMLDAIGHLWDKLRLDSLQLANLHTLVVAQQQNNVPPQFLSESSDIEIVSASDIDDTYGKLQAQALPRRVIRKFERGECEQLEFRLPDASAPLESHFQTLPLSCTDGDLVEIIAGEVVADKLLGSTNSPSCWVLLGPPGCGKSTLLVYLAWVSTNQNLPYNHLIPARIRLRAWESWDRAHPESRLHDYLAAHYSNVVEHAPGASDWERWLGRGQVLLLLDGLDEVSDSQWYIEKQRQQSGFSNTTIVTTCRTSNYDAYANHLGDSRKCHIGTLSHEQCITFIKNYPAKYGIDQGTLMETLKDTNTLHTLALNPLLLSIICYAADVGDHPFTLTTRAGIYEQLLKQLLERPSRVEVRYPAEPPATHDKLVILGKIALPLFARNKLSFTETELEKVLASVLEIEGYSPVALWVSSFLKDFFDNSGILRRHKSISKFSQNSCYFLHATIQEFLCAFRLHQDSGDKTIDAAIETALAKFGLQEIAEKSDSKDPHWGEIAEMLDEMRTDTNH